MVKFPTKKQIVHYVGKVVEEVEGEVGEQEYVVDYLRRWYDDDQGEKYAFGKPNAPDKHPVSVADVLKKLPQPFILKNLALFHK